MQKNAFSLTLRPVRAVVHPELSFPNPKAVLAGIWVIGMVFLIFMDVLKVESCRLCLELEYAGIYDACKLRFPIVSLLPRPTYGSNNLWVIQEWPLEQVILNAPGPATPRPAWEIRSPC